MYVDLLEQEDRLIADNCPQHVVSVPKFIHHVIEERVDRQGSEVLGVNQWILDQTRPGNVIINLGSGIYRRFDPVHLAKGNYQLVELDQWTYPQLATDRVHQVRVNLERLGRVTVRSSLQSLLDSKKRISTNAEIESVVMAHLMPYLSYAALTDVIDWSVNCLNVKGNLFVLNHSDHVGGFELYDRAAQAIQWGYKYCVQHPSLCRQEDYLLVPTVPMEVGIKLGELIGKPDFEEAWNGILATYPEIVSTELYAVNLTTRIPSTPISKCENGRSAFFAGAVRYTRFQKVG